MFYDEVSLSKQLSFLIIVINRYTFVVFTLVLLFSSTFFSVDNFIDYAHAANANLFVSAENSQFDNYMSGPQVIEVVVIDSYVGNTDKSQGEPDVTINGKILRMVQGVDGNWYGYFADKTQASIADYTAASSGIIGQGLDFGTLCAPGTDTNTTIGVDVSDTAGIAIPISAPGLGQNGTSTGSRITSQCIADPQSVTGAMNVVRESIDPNTVLPGDSIGQIGISDTDVWPFIQLYQLNPTGNVSIDYNKGGGVQSTTLTFDTVDQFVRADLDRAIYPHDAQVHVTITDLWLNIDPTDEDSWTFGTNSTDGLTTNYQVFDENGAEAGAAVANGIIDISNNLPNMMVEDNGVLILNVDQQSVGTNVVTIRDTLDTVITCSMPQDASTCATSDTAVGLGINSQPVTITEMGPNSGIFGTYDESDESVLLITSDAKRGTSATIDYNESPVTVLVGFDFGTIDIQPIDDEWNSGEEIPVVLTDKDLNQNSKVDEDLDLDDPTVELIPSLQTGNPFTLKSLNTAQLAGSSLNVKVQKFSDRAMLTTSSDISFQNKDTLVLTLNNTFADLYQSINQPGPNFKGFNLLNFDIGSIQNSLGVTINSFDVDITDGTNTARLASNITRIQDLVDIANATGDDIFAMNKSSKVQYIFTINTGGGPSLILANTVLPIVTDFFSFGFLNDGISSSDRISNQIIRFELEETGDDTGIFVGSLEYKMINQINILDPTTYTMLNTIDDDPSFIVIENLTDEDAPRVTYLDLGADGISTPITDQEDAPSHSGFVSFDKSNYEITDTVTITLEDLDLNTDSHLLDLYTVVTAIEDQNQDAVGTGNATSGGFSIALSNGDQLGRLLDVTIDDIRWTTSQGSCTTTGAAATDSGLGATGFILVETGQTTGIFTGDFQIPNNWCRTDSATPESSTGHDIDVNYVDFRDASGEVIEVSDAARISGIKILPTTLNIEINDAHLRDVITLNGTGLPGTIDTVWNLTPSNLKLVNAFGNSLDIVKVGQQVQISTDLVNSLDKEQSFAYLIQIQDDNRVLDSLTWITGSLSRGQSFTPALSWIPTHNGNYTATAFFWESVDNPAVLHPSISTNIVVGSDNGKQQTISTFNSLQLPVTYLIQDPYDNVVKIGEIYPNAMGLFLEQIITAGNHWSSIGKYTVTAQYGNTINIANFSLNATVSESPTNLLAIPGNGKVTLSWSAPTDDGGYPITDYVIRYKKITDDSYTRFTLNASSSTFVITGLENGIKYQFKVYAKNLIGTGNVNKITATPTMTIPNSPTNLIVVGNTNATLSWSAPTDDGGSPIIDYIIRYKNSTLPFTTFSDGKSNSITSVITGLTNGEQYKFRVAAVNEIGRGAFTNTVVPNAETITITPDTGSGSSTDDCVNIKYGCYVPGIATVDLGGKIIFSNTDSAAHTFSAGTAIDGPTGEFDTGLLMTGNSFEFYPDTVGDINYFCMVHPWMNGLIQVSTTPVSMTPAS